MPWPLTSQSKSAEIMSDMKHYQVAAGIHAGRVNEASALASLLQAAGVNGKRFIIKVNWFGPEYGYFTDARTLDLVLSSLPPSEKIVVEGHAYGRNDGSREINWRDLNEAFDKWEWILQQEAWFLESTGLAEVLKKHGTKYINVTDEVWAGRAVSAETVAAAVEVCYSPVADPEMYTFIPEKLWDLRGTTLISLARIKVRSPNALAEDASPYSPIYSLSMKNLFGLVPDPFRFRWHGTKGQRLAQSILDNAKIYSALFDVVGFNEGIFHTLLNDPIGEHETNWGRYDIADDQGVAVLGRNLIQLDTFTAALFFPLDWQRWPLFEMAVADFGPVEKQLLDTSPPDFADIADDCLQRYGAPAAALAS